MASGCWHCGQGAGLWPKPDPTLEEAISWCDPQLLQVWVEASFSLGT
jgi:hypothetical protein